MSAFLKDSIVSTQESQALKEMIFNRARERAAALTNNVQETYTSNLQSDIMDIARESFRANKNPFSIDYLEKEQSKTETTEQASSRDYSEGIGFSKKNVEAIKSQINFRNKVVVEKVTNQAVESSMADARNDVSKNSGFIGALDFLNSQATISLVKSKGKSFDAIA